MRYDSIVVLDAIRALLPSLGGSRPLDEMSAAVEAQKPSVLSQFGDPALLKTAVDRIARDTRIAN